MLSAYDQSPLMLWAKSKWTWQKKNFSVSYGYKRGMIVASDPLYPLLGLCVSFHHLPKLKWKTLNWVKHNVQFSKVFWIKWYTFPCKLRKRRIFQICIDCLYFCLWKTWIQFSIAFIPLMILFRYFMTVFFISGLWDKMLYHSVSCFFTLVVSSLLCRTLIVQCTSTSLAILLEPLSDTPCSQISKRYPHVFHEQF